MTSSLPISSAGMNYEGYPTYIQGQFYGYPTYIQCQYEVGCPYIFSL